MGDFDFWVGEWEALWEGGQGTNLVTAELDGTVILERFDGRPGTDLQGISVTVHDGTEWRQTWVDSQHGYIELRGGLDNDVMELRHERDGVPFRMRFTDIADDAFVWLWESRSNGSWEERWRIDYRRLR